MSGNHAAQVQARRGQSIVVPISSVATFEGIGSWVRIVREGCGLSLNDVEARDPLLDKSRMSRYENDRMHITKGTLAKIAHAFGCSEKADTTEWFFKQLERQGIDHLSSPKGIV